MKSIIILLFVAVVQCACAGSIDMREQQNLSLPITVPNGGTGLTGCALGDIIYGSAPNTFSVLVGNTAASRTFLRQEGTGTVSAAPAWDTVTKTDVGLSNVENTALSTWAGSANLVTLGTVTTGVWNGTAIDATHGGTNQTTWTLGDLLYSDGANTLAKLPGSTVAAKRFLRQTGTGAVSAAPAWDTVTSGDVGLGNVENTALSTWAGSANLVTLGTVTTGVWNGTAIDATHGGTNQTTWTLGDLLYSDGSNTLAKLPGSTVAAKRFLRQTGTGAVSAAPAWDTLASSDVGLGNVENTALSTWAGSANLVTLGTVTTGVWNGTAIDATHGGTNQTTWTIGDSLYADGTNTLAKLPGNSTTTKKFMRQTGTGSAPTAPAWDTVTSTDVGLGNVENTALSSWAGTANISTVGNITSGTWNGTEISSVKGGTGQTGYAIGDLLYASSTTALGKLANGTTGQFLMANTGAAESWASPGTPSALGTAAAAGAAGGFAGAAHVHAAPTVTGPGLAATSTTGLILTTTTGNMHMTASSVGGNTTLQLAYIPTDGLVNRVINGEMRINQRYAGTPVSIVTAASNYVIDRWNGYGQPADGSYTISQSTTSPPSGFSHYLHATTMLADASIGNSQMYMIRQPIEANNITDLAEGTASSSSITLGFYARSNTTGQFGGAILSTSAGSYPFKYTINAANTWELQSITVPGDTAGVGTWTNSGIGIGATVSFDMGCGSDYTGTANAWVAAVNFGSDSDVQLIGIRAATLDLTAVQLVKGTVAPQYLARAYSEELRLCQRYGWALGPGIEATIHGMGQAYDGLHGILCIKNPVEMRIKAAALSYPVGAATDFTVTAAGITAKDVTAMSLYNYGSSTISSIAITATAGDLVAGDVFLLRQGANANAVIFLECEL